MSSSHSQDINTKSIWNERHCSLCCVLCVGLCTVSCEFVLDYFSNYNVPYKKFRPSCKKDTVLYIFFWVFPRRQIVVGRRFGTLYQFDLQTLGVQCTPSLWSWKWYRVPKRRPNTIWRRGNTQKKIYNIQITAKVWNQEYVTSMGRL